MADAKSSTPHLHYRKKELPPVSEIDAEMRRVLQYDDVNGGFIWIKVRRVCQKGLIGMKAGGNDGRGYQAINLLNHKFKLHRLVWLWHYGSMPDFMIDHINGNRSDNRIENLRESTMAQNTLNRIKRSGALPIGVSQDEATQKFKARIQMPDGVKVYLGSYETCNEAAAAYVGASTVLHGAFSIFAR